MDEFTKKEAWILFRWAAIGLAGIAVLGVMASWLGLLGSAATAPARVVTKTMQTDNIIASYEWFHDVNAQYEARRKQIKAHANLVAAETDAKERSRLNIELSAMQQSCRDLATKYNANSEKVNKSVFKGDSLPVALQINSCEG